MSPTLFEAFCAEFDVDASELGRIITIGRGYYLYDGEPELLERMGTHLFSAGLFLGEEKRRFEPSVALLELLAARTENHKVVVDEKAAWLFLCGRDILSKGAVKTAEPTESGYLLVQNERDENLGYGLVGKRGNMAVKNLLDRGNFLRRERFS